MKDGDVSSAVLSDLAAGSDIGFLYIYSYQGGVGDALASAIAPMMGSTDGLIIDHRYNYGGLMSQSSPLLSQLLDEDIAGAVQCRTRLASGGYEELGPCPVGVTPESYIDIDPETFYSGPIALLTGPNSVSAGDFVPFFLRRHPNVRVFGRATSGEFGARDVPWGPDPILGDLWLALTYMFYLDDAGDPLLGSEQDPDEDVWLTREDVIAGRDTVLEAAAAWLEACLAEPTCPPTG